MPTKSGLLMQFLLGGICVGAVWLECLESLPEDFNYWRCCLFVMKCTVYCTARMN